MLTVKCEFSAGSSIDDATLEAVALARRLGVPVGFDFNGHTVRAFPSSDPGDLVRFYLESRKIGSMLDSMTDEAKGRYFALEAQEQVERMFGA